MGKHIKNEKFELYHPNHGIIKGTKEDFYKLEPRFKSKKNFSNLVKGRECRLYGWVTADKINEVPTPRNRNLPRKFYCPEKGVIEATLYEFYEKYIKEEGGTYANISSLTSGNIKVLYSKWVLAENKDKYEELINPDKTSYITLHHPYVGTLTLKRSEFISKYGLTKKGIVKLKSGANKTHLGWSIVRQEVKE